MPPNWSTLASSGTALALLTTLAVFRLALLVFERSERNALLHPLITAPSVIALGLIVLQIDFSRYQQGSALLSYALGPATVALAIPLYHQAANFRRHLPAILLTTLVGGTIAVTLAMGSAILAGAEQEVIRSIASKSITTPIAVAVSEIIGGIPQLAAGAVIITGVTGAVVGPPLLAKLGITDSRVVGFTLGLTAHGIGTARAFDIDKQAGSYASLGMGINGMLTALLLPLILN